MRFPVAWASEVCDEADAVLAQDKHRIANDLIDGKYWAAHCYEVAVERVRARRSAART